MNRQAPYLAAFVLLYSIISTAAAVSTTTIPAGPPPVPLSAPQQPSVPSTGGAVPQAVAEPHSFSASAFGIITLAVLAVIAATVAYLRNRPARAARRHRRS